VRVGGGGGLWWDLITFKYFWLFFVFGGCCGVVCGSGFSGWEGYYS